jgi:hypothetical protein
MFAGEVPMSRTVATIDRVQIERANRARRLIPLVLLTECIVIGGFAVAIRSGMFSELTGLVTPFSIVAVVSGFTALVLKMVFSRRP